MCFVMSKNFVMEKYGGESEDFSAGVWSSDNGFRKCWQGGEVQIDPTVNYPVSEHVSAAHLGADNLYLGLNTGVVQEVYLGNREVLSSVDRWDVDGRYRAWDLHGGKGANEQYTADQALVRERKFSVLTRLADERDAALRPQIFGVDFFARRGREINDIVEFKGDVYDGSSMGLFHTEENNPLVSKNVTSLSVWDGRLCYVSVGPNVLAKLESGSTGFKGAGDLVDVFSGETLVQKLTPFDGSGCKPGTYSIVGDTAYINHGNWPGERITRRDLRSGEEKGHVRVPTSYGFVPHNGKMFDIRNHHGNSWLTSSDEGDHVRKSLFGPAAITSAVSDDGGILVTKYDHERDLTNVSLIETEDGLECELDDIEGRATFI